MLLELLLSKDPVIPMSAARFKVWSAVTLAIVDRTSEIFPCTHSEV